MKKNHDELPIFIEWIEFLPWVFNTTSKFPKNIRGTLTARVENISLDITEKIIEARYVSNKILILSELDILLEKIRILWRIAYSLRFLNTKSYEYAIKKIANIGRQVGGWLKQQRTNEKK